MSFTISDYCDVPAKAQALGLNVPDGLALLPRNFVDATSINELLHESAVQTVRILFRQNEIPETRLERKGQKIPCIKENEFALILPALFVGGLLLTQNLHLLSIALNVIANYATDFFKGIPRRKKVVLDVIVEDKTGRRSKKIHYEGEAEGLKEIAIIAGKVFTDE
jgi:hypothetical protein